MDPAARTQQHQQVHREHRGAVCQFLDQIPQQHFIARGPAGRIHVRRTGHQQPIRFRATKVFRPLPEREPVDSAEQKTEPDDYPRLRTQNRTTVILATEPIPPTTIRLYVHGRQPKIKTVLYKRLHAHLGALSQIYADARRTGGKRCVQYNRRHRSFRLEHPNRPAKQYAQTDELQREPQYPGPDYQMVDAQREPERQPQREHADATGRTSKGDYLYFPRKHEQHLHLQEKLQFHDRGILHEPVTGRKRPGGGLPHGQCRPERQLL